MAAPTSPPTTRARVEQLLDQHQYPRSGPRPQRRSGLIDLVFNGLDSPWAVEILRGVEEWGAEHGTAIAVSSVRHGDARPTSWTSTIASHHSDGVILVTTKLTDTQVGAAARGRHTARRHRPGQHAAGGHPVGRRDQLGGRVRRHRAPALASATGGSPRSPGPADTLCSLARLDGYRSGLERAGVAFDPALVRYGDFHHEGGFARAVELLDLPTGRRRSSRAATSRPSASTRPPASTACASPRTCRVVGFDELPVSRWASPPMTTVRQPLAEMGNAAAQMLGELIDGHAAAVNPGGAVHRADRAESTAAPCDRARHPEGVTHSDTSSGQPPKLAGRASSRLAGPGAAGRRAGRRPARPDDAGGEDRPARQRLDGRVGRRGRRRADAGPVFDEEQPPLDELIKNGLGQLTRVFGTRPVPAAAGMRALAGLQARIVASSRFGIPAVAHEECLTGFAAWGATIFPTPLGLGRVLRPGAGRRDGARRSARPCARSASTRGSRRCST